MEFRQSSKLANVCYDIRGPVLDVAKAMEAAGQRILKLNIGNPAPFGMTAPDELVQDMIVHLPISSGYGDSKGLPSARRAVVDYYETKGLPEMDLDDVFLGNGVSELIMMSMQALCDTGDEVLVPSPDYPLWTAAVTLSGGTAVHYRCDEQADWMPDLDDIRRKVSDRTKAIVIINPNNPTGAVYSRDCLTEMVEIARSHGLMILSDEIYDRIVYDGAEHVSPASLAPDLLCLTMSGLSKVYRAPGYRSGWLAITGPKHHATSYIEGLNLLANMRMCPGVPAQHAVQAALSGNQSIVGLVAEGGRLHEQRDVAFEMLNAIDGVSCVKPAGALYAFPRLDAAKFNIRDDEKFALDLLQSEKILIVQGSGFNYPTPDHFRVVTLPHATDLTEALTRLGSFLETYRQS